MREPFGTVWDVARNLHWVLYLAGGLVVLAFKFVFRRNRMRWYP